MSEYELKRDGVDAQVKAAKDTAEAIRTLSGSNTAESIVTYSPDGITAYDPETGSRIQYAQGQLRFWDNYDTSPEEFGEMLVDPGAGTNIFRFFPPHSDGTGIENSVTVQGRRPGQPGHAWVYSDGSIRLRVQDDVGTKLGDMVLSADRVDIDANKLGLYSLPTTSNTSNLYLGYVGAEWTTAYVTSSRRYKTDIEDVAIDADAVLRWQPRTWRDKADVEAIGDDAVEHIGFIAEEIHEQTPEFVVLDDEGQPNALKYDRMVAGLLAVAQQHAELIAAQDARLAARDVVIADLTARLEALEAT